MSLSKEEQKILDSIVVRSENDPNNPEFPPDNPNFPATPTYKIEVPGFSNVWIKDESFNPTGTHKDRMAWEIVVTYKHFLTAKKYTNTDRKLPSMSIISSGSSAVAIQRWLNKYDLPHLKVLVDINMNKNINEYLHKIGCEVYETDLSRKVLNWKEILLLTHNSDGFDITSMHALDPTLTFYDWMSYEIINESPDYCFVPFGTGNLFENILNINKKEVSCAAHDPRFKGDVNKLRKCNFIGATTHNPKTKADKLYSPHLPFTHFDEQWIKLYRFAGFCGSKSNVYAFKESNLSKAMEIAESQGVACEPSGIAGLAMLLQMSEQIPSDSKILIVNTGKLKFE